MAIGVADILLLGVCPLLLLVSGFISGSETALFSLNREQRSRFQKAGTVAGQAVTTLLAETRHLLITLLLVNMVVNVLFFIITTVLLLKWREHMGAVWIAVLSVTPLLLLILGGEVLPKLVAARLTLTWVRWTAVPLLVVHRVIGPVRTVLHALVVTPLARLIAPRTGPTELTPQELEELLRLSERRGVIDADEEYLLQQVLELSRLKVRHLMTPRVNLHGHDLDDDPAVLMERLRETGLSQLPVYRGDIDHVEGIVFARQALVNPPTTKQQAQALVRQVTFVPEQQPAPELLVHFRKRGTTLAVAVDEYGGTAGIVTLEDVVEQMVGEIPGPYDTADQPKVQSVSPGVFRVSGQLAVHDWADEFESIVAERFRHRMPGVSTLGGLVQARLGRLPKVNDRVHLGNVVIEVEAMVGPRIKSLLIQVQPRQKGKAGGTT